ERAPDLGLHLLEGALHSRLQLLERVTPGPARIVLTLHRSPPLFVWTRLRAEPRPSGLRRPAINGFTIGARGSCQLSVASYAAPLASYLSPLTLPFVTHSYLTAASAP